MRRSSSDMKGSASSRQRVAADCVRASPISSRSTRPTAASKTVLFPIAWT